MTNEPMAQERSGRPRIKEKKSKNQLFIDSHAGIFPVATSKKNIGALTMESRKKITFPNVFMYSKKCEPAGRSAYLKLS